MKEGTALEPSHVRVTYCMNVSYDNRLPPELAYFKKHIHFDEALGKEIEIEVRKFLQELEREIEEIKTNVWQSVMKITLLKKVIV